MLPPFHPLNPPIQVPGQKKGVRSHTVEGVWQGLKEFDKEGIDPTKFKIQNMQNIKRGNSRGGKGKRGKRYKRTSMYQIFTFHKDMIQMYAKNAGLLILHVLSENI